MSEQNILNPSVGHALNPDYSIPHNDPALFARWQARGGKPWSRRMLTRGQVFQFQWQERLFADFVSLKQWFRQYEADFFSYADYDHVRYYSGQFMDEPSYERVGFNKVTVKAAFVEIPGVAMFQYPSNWGVDSVFREEKNGFGDDIPKYTGAGWAGNIAVASASAHGGAWSTSNVTNDTAEILYMGYGFRFWSQKGPALGIAEISLDGNVAASADLYNAAAVASAPLATLQNVSLGEHRVKIRCTGTKNASSSGFTVGYDSIEVMR